MHKPLPYVLFYVLFAFLTVSCAQTARSKPDLIQAAVQATLTAQLTPTSLTTTTASPQSTQTPVSTSTLVPTSTSTPAPPATLVVDMVPADWQTYQFIGAPLIVAYPPNWAVLGEGVRELVLKYLDDPTYLMGISIVKSSPVPGATDTDMWRDYDQQARTLKQIYLGSKELSGNGPSRFVTEGRLDTNQQQAYVVAINDTDQKETFVTVIRDGENAALLILIKVSGGHLPDDAVVAASQIAKYSHWIVGK